MEARARVFSDEYDVLEPVMAIRSAALSALRRIRDSVDHTLTFAGFARLAGYPQVCIYFVLVSCASFVRLVDCVGL